MDELPRRELFDEELYLRTFRDIALAVRDGEFSSGYEHWARHGRFEVTCSQRISGSTFLLLRSPTVSRPLGSVTTWPATIHWVILPSEGSH